MHALAKNVITIGVDLPGVQSKAMRQGTLLAGSESQDDVLNEIQGMAWGIEGHQETIAQGFDQRSSMAVELLSNERQIVLDLLNRNQLVSKDFGGGINNITEDDRPQTSIMARFHGSPPTTVRYTV